MSCDYYDLIRHIYGLNLYLLADTNFTSGTNVPDFSKKTGTMTLAGNPTLNSEVTPYGVRSILCDGTDDSIGVNGTSINSYFTGNVISIGMWVKPTFDWSDSNVRTFCEFSANGTSERIRIFKGSTANQLNFLVVGDDASSTTISLTSQTWTDWNLIIATFQTSDGDMNIYRYNGTTPTTTESQNGNYGGSWSNNTLNLIGNTAIYGRSTSSSVNFLGYVGCFFMSSSITTQAGRQVLARH